MAKPNKKTSIPSPPRIKTAFKPITLSVPELDCASCAAIIERTLNFIPGVCATLNLATKTAHILAPSEMRTKQLTGAVRTAGFSATDISRSRPIALDNKRSATALFFALLFTVPAIAISIMSSWHPAIDRWILFQLDTLNLLHPKYSPTAWLVIGLCAPVILVVAFPIHRAGFRNLIRPTVDTLTMLGSLTAFGWSIYANSTGHGKVYAQVSATIILIVVFGRFLEFRAKRRASKALSILLASGSKQVTVVREGQSVLVPISHLMVGDHFLAEPGEHIVSNGVIISGESKIDNSLVGGQVEYFDVSPGTSVIAGSFNTSGLLLIRATRRGSDTDLARMTAMVLTAQGMKVSIQRRADRISAVLVPSIILLSIATFLTRHYTDHSLAQSISSAIAVLVIACPSALGLATPVALLVAFGRGAQRGIVICEPRVFDDARKIDSVILDKTGTLTNGSMTLANLLVVPEAGKILGPNFQDILREDLILSSALSIELHSDHQVAIAIATFISAKGIKPASVTAFSRTPGAGSAGRVNLGTQSPAVLIGSPVAVAHATTPFHEALTHEIFQAQEKGLTVSVLAWDGVALAMFAVVDEIKADAKRTITELREHGIEPWLVTGDSSQVALSVAREVGIPVDHVVSGALPQDKVDKVMALQAKGHRVLMIGDGVNDAAALASADLTIAMGTGTDTAIATADIVVMRRDLGSVIDAMNLSSKTLRIIRGNLSWALLYNVIAIPVAAMGAMQPMYAAGAMAFSSLFVVTNSLRIK